MRLFREALCTMVAAGLLAACSGTTLSPAAAIPSGASKSGFMGARGVGTHQSMTIPCRCYKSYGPAVKKSHKRTKNA